MPSIPRKLSFLISPISRVLLTIHFNRKALKSSSIVFLPHQGYGDLIVCLPIFKYFSQRGVRVKVLVPGKHIDFLKIFLLNSSIELVSIEKAFQGYSSSRSWVNKSIRYAKQVNSTPLILGYDLIPVFSKIYPGLDHNSIFYLIAGVPEPAKEIINYEKCLLDVEGQIETPSKPYALVDHFPGTSREIHLEVLTGLENKGLEIVLNPRSVPYEKMLNLIVCADELHLVNSSLLCLCLFLPVKATSKNIYLIEEGLYQNSGFFSTEWVEWAPNDSKASTRKPYRQIDSVEFIRKTRSRRSSINERIALWFILGGRDGRI